MDKRSVEKIVSRKRLLEKADEIQEKILKENKEIIKRHKENLATAKANNRRLQQNMHLQLLQNMLQLQMQYESLWRNYQELSRRLIINRRRKLAEIEKELKTELEKHEHRTLLLLEHERQLGRGAGVDMTSFPSFKFEEPKLD